MTMGKGFISRRTTNSAHGGDSIGGARAQSMLPIRRRDLGMLSDIHADDVYIRGIKKATVKWHDGFTIEEARAYRGMWTIRVKPLREGDACWFAALDVDLRSRTVHRMRGIGTATMAFVHKTRTEAEITIDRYRYQLGERDHAA